MKPVREYLTDLLTYLEDIDSFTRAGESAFAADRKTQLAVMRAYEIVGEIVKRLPSELLDRQSHIDWKAIKGFRDVLIHQYDNVDLGIVWGAVERLPALRAAIEALLDELPPDEPIS